MEKLVQLARKFVLAMRERRGLAHVEEIYAENAQSIEAVAPPGRDLRIAKGRGAIKGKRLDWATTHPSTGETARR